MGSFKSVQRIIIAKQFAAGHENQAFKWKALRVERAADGLFYFRDASVMFERHLNGP